VSVVVEAVLTEEKLLSLLAEDQGSAGDVSQRHRQDTGRETRSTRGMWTRKIIFLGMV